jgi:hypothetical protein
LFGGGFHEAGAPKQKVLENKNRIYVNSIPGIPLPAGGNTALLRSSVNRISCWSKTFSL